MARTITKVLGLAFAALVAIVLGALGVFWLTFDPNAYRTLITDLVSQTLDREIAITGDIEIAPSLVPTLAVNGLTIANPPWASTATMAAAGRLEVTLALLPLLEHRIEINHIGLEQIAIALERDADGNGNWELAFLRDTPEPAPTATGAQSRVDAIELSDVTLSYAIAGADTLVAHVERMTLERSPAGSLAITALGAVQDLPLTFDWRAGPLDDAAVNDELRWPVATTLALGDTTVALTGRLRGPAAFTRAEFAFRITGENAAQLQALVDLPPSDGLRYDLRGTARIDPDSVLVTGLSGSFVGGRFFSDTRLDDGSVTLRRGERTAATLTGTAAGQPFAIAARLGALDAMLATPQARWPLDVETTLGGAALTASGEIARDTDGPSAQLDLAISGDVVATANRLRPLEIPDPGPLALTTTLHADPARVQLTDTQLEIADGTIAGRVLVTDLDATPRVTADLAVTGIDVTAFAPPATQAPAAAPADAPLPLDWLDRVAATVDLTIAAPRGLPVPLDAATIAANLEDGALEIAALDARVAGIELNGRGSLRRSANVPELTLAVTAARIDLETLLTALGREPIPQVTTTTGSVELSVDTRGATLRRAIDNARIGISVNDARLAVTNDATDATYTAPAIVIASEPGLPVRLETTGHIAAHAGGETLDDALELALTGGMLSELIESRVIWPHIELDAATRFRGQTLAMSAQIDDTAALLRSAATPVAVRGNWGPVRARLAGTLLPTSNLTGTAARIDLETDDLAALAMLLDVDGMPAERGSVSAELAVSDTKLMVRDATLALPGIDGSGELTLLWQARPALQANWQFSRLDATPYVARSDASEGGDSTDAPRPALHDLYSEDPLPLAWLRRIDLDARAGVAAFRFGEFVSNDVGLGLQLDGGALAIDASLDGGRVSAAGTLDARTDELVFELETAGESLPLAADMTAPSAAGTPVVSFAAALGGRGSSSLAIAESARGSVELYMRGGRMPASGLRFFFGSVLYQLIDVVNPFTQRQSYMDIDCAGAYFDVENGVLTTRNGILLQTPELQIVGVGQTNIANGDLRMTFRTKRRTGIVPSIGSVVNEFVELTGTLDAPRVRISAEQTARRGLLAIATGGLSVLAVDMFGRLTSGNICEDLPARVGADRTQDK